MRQSAFERYANDPIFHTLVDMFYNVLCQDDFTPSEIREAALLASIKYEQNHVHTLLLDKLTGVIRPLSREEERIILK